MNENLDLTKILEGCPIGTEFYHLIYGKVWFIGINLDDKYSIKLSLHNDNSINVATTKEGLHLIHYPGDCILFPSKDQRDWSKFERFWDNPKVEKFDINTLQPFDKILARDRNNDIWRCALFSHLVNKYEFPIFATSSFYRYCIPYNDETKYLIGTKEDCPEYYKWWRE